MFLKNILYCKMSDKYIDPSPFIVPGTHVVAERKDTSDQFLRRQTNSNINSLPQTRPVLYTPRFDGTGLHGINDQAPIYQDASTLMPIHTILDIDKIQKYAGYERFRGDSIDPRVRADKRKRRGFGCCVPVQSFRAKRMDSLITEVRRAQALRGNRYNEPEAVLAAEALVFEKWANSLDHSLQIKNSLIFDPAKRYNPNPIMSDIPATPENNDHMMEDDIWAELGRVIGWSALIIFALFLGGFLIWLSSSSG